MTEETHCSLAASDKGSYHREWPSEPSNYEESIGASRQNILRTEEKGLLNVWTDFNRNSDSESPDDLIPNNILRAQTTRKRIDFLKARFRFLPSVSRSSRDFVARSGSLRSLAALSRGRLVGKSRKRTASVITAIRWNTL